MRPGYKRHRPRNLLAMRPDRGPRQAGLGHRLGERHGRRRGGHRREDTGGRGRHLGQRLRLDEHLHRLNMVGLQAVEVHEVVALGTDGLLGAHIGVCTSETEGDVGVVCVRDGRTIVDHPAETPKRRCSKFNATHQEKQASQHGSSRGQFQWSKHTEKLAC